MSSPSQPTQLPGFGLRLDHMPQLEKDRVRGRFPHAIADSFAPNGITLREKRMLDFVNQITDKPNWTSKVHDEFIVERWRDEACGSSFEQETSSKHLSMACFDYCLRELRDKTNYLERHGFIHVLDAKATVIKSDMSDDDDLCDALSQAAKPLEDIPNHHRDWHPGSDEKVLDMVHPSLFPLEYGKSRVLRAEKVPLSECVEFIGRGEVCPIVDKRDLLAYPSPNPYLQDHRLEPWGSYQWLPSDIYFDANGEPNIGSYVNNLHPIKHREVYAVLEKALRRAIPAWNECLSSFNRRSRIIVDRCGFENFRPPSWTVVKQAGYRIRDHFNFEDPRERGERDRSFAADAWLRDHPNERILNQPDPTNEYVPFDQHLQAVGARKLDLAADFPAGIQVIFKLASIHLTPEKTQFDGSNWHIEGALNEHICATALIYYDQDNIEPNYLEFRTKIDEYEMACKPLRWEHPACEDLFGLDEDGGDTIAIQVLGRVLTRSKRILAFPNVMQHRVQPFGLADPSKPGFRKILAMFLVDPHIKILSTSNVPPQRRDWWAEEIQKISPFADLPIELFERIIGMVDDFPIGWEEACVTREALMEERGKITDDHNEILEDDMVTFCEH